jgi:hypothetical protein
MYYAAGRGPAWERALSEPSPHGPGLMVLFPESEWTGPLPDAPGLSTIVIFFFAFVFENLKRLLISKWYPWL